ncbi:MULTISPECIES: hypothetical protein [Comamonas]|uniref:hypothetical protein n=1 Tax=Comamonas thiooxydans TaxID=363952 RepID=UPI0021156807|nr:hypothetical protein [Comamonas thiooxydans]UUE94951.1 hypothetical protein MJ608_04645 [Comamonas thiooxydans]
MLAIATTEIVLENQSSHFRVIRNVFVPYDAGTSEKPNIAPSWSTVSDHQRKLCFFESVHAPCPLGESQGIGLQPENRQD